MDRDKMKTLAEISFGAKSFLNSLLNHNILPIADPLLSWLKQPVGWVVCATISSLMIGLCIGPQGFVLMWSFISLLVIGFIWPWVSIQAISSELVFKERRTSEGKETLAILKIKNRFPVFIHGLTVEGSFLQEIIDEEDLVVAGLERVPGWSVSEFKWKLTPNKRGQLPATPPKLVTGFPFGIIRCSKDLIVQNKVIVWPASHSLQGKPKSSAYKLGANEIADLKPGKNGETNGVREFRQGDSFRDVHWAKTAQNSRLVVKEFQSTSHNSVHIILDLSYSSHTGSGGQSSFEWAIRTTASICQQLDSHRFLIHLECVGLPKSASRFASNAKEISDLLDFLALLPEFGFYQSKEKIIFSRSQKQSYSRAGFTFLVCTDRSFLQQGISPEVKKIEIGCDLFDAEASPPVGPRKIDTKDNPESLFLNSPTTAASDLYKGWKSQFSYET